MHTQPRLTSTMHTTLEVAAKHGQVGLRRVHKPNERPLWPAHPSTLKALVLRQLLKHEHAKHRHGWPLERWTVTDQGHHALLPVERTIRDLPVYLSRSGGQIKYRKLPSTSTTDLGRWTIDDDTDGNGDYTTDPSRSIDIDRAPNSRTHLAVCVLVGPAELDVFASKAQDRENDRLKAAGDRLDTLPIDYRLDKVAEHAASARVDVTVDVRKIRHLHALNRVQPALNHLVELEQRLALRYRQAA